MRSRLLVLLATVVSVTMLGACSAGGDPDEPPPAAAHADDVSPSNALPDPAPGSVTVDDPAGDGGSADLRAVTLTLDATNLVTRYELAAGVPATGTVLLVVTVYSEDGSVVRQLGTQWVDHAQPLVYSYDFVGTQENFDDIVPVEEGTTVTVTYPASAVAGLGETFVWSAVTNVDGNDVDSAPDTDAAAFPA